MKEDILEQLIDGYFLRQPGTFTKHNVKYRPDQSTISKENKRLYSVHSDIDVITINLKDKSTNVVSCKSWQGGFDVKHYLELLSDSKKMTIVSGREVWKTFRELTNPIWSKAFRDKIYEETNSKTFNYYIAVTKLINSDRDYDFCNNKEFIKLLSNDGEFNVTIKFLTLEKIIEEIRMGSKSTAVESTEIGRILQLIEAAGLKITK